MRFYELIMEVDEYQSSTIRRGYKFTSIPNLSKWLKSVASDPMFQDVVEVRMWYPINGQYVHDILETAGDKAKQLFIKLKTTN